MKNNSIALIISNGAIAIALAFTLGMQNQNILNKIDQSVKPVTIKENSFKIIDAQFMGIQEGEEIYSVGLDKGEGYFNLTLPLIKFSAMGVDADSVLLYSNL